MIYTIGYADYNTNDFVGALLKYNISILFDVRSVPFSKYYSNFNKEQLCRALSNNKIEYVFVGDKLGGKPKNNKLYTNNIVDYNKMLLDDDFKKGLNKIIENKQRNICLMCSEKKAINCHRAILLGRVLSNLGLSVLHIEKNIPLLSQKDIEQELKNIYFPDGGQTSLFDENEDYEFLLNKAYMEQNKKIGSKYSNDENDSY